MKKYLAKIIKSAVFRNLTIVSLANFISAGFGLLCLVIISRLITVGEFGLFQISLSVMILLSLFTDIGMDTGVIRFAAFYLGSNRPAEAAQAFRITLTFKLISCLVFALTIAAGSDWISRNIFNLAALSPLLKLSAIGIISYSLINYLKSVLYVYRLFKELFLLQIIMDLTKIFLVIAACTFLKCRPEEFILAYALCPLLAFLLGYRKIRPLLKKAGKMTKTLLQKIFSFSKWVFVSDLCKQILPYLGVFLLGKLSGSQTAGIYGLAVSLTAIFPILALSIKSAVYPEIAGNKDINRIKKYLKFTLEISLYVILACLPLLFISRPAIIVIFGARYASAAVIFNWLLLGNIAMFTINAIRLALYSLNKPRMLAIVDILRVALIGIGGYLLIPGLGAIAPAILLTAANCLAAVFLALYSFGIIKRSPAGLTVDDTAILPQIY
jgi:O-antigen/teichoic acid export membrane protein